MAKFDCATTPSTLAQSKERKGSNFAIWQPCAQDEQQQQQQHHLGLQYGGAHAQSTAPGGGSISEDEDRAAAVAAFHYSNMYGGSGELLRDLVLNPSMPGS